MSHENGHSADPARPEARTRDSAFLSDVKELRQRARQHLEQILANEEHHADELAQLLATFDSRRART